MKERLRSSLIRTAVVLGIGGIYAAFVMISGLGIPCPFYLFTGLKCPGCGISRMLIAILQGDLHSAFHYNSFLFLTLPIIVACLVWNEICYVKNKNTGSKVINAVLWVEIASALIFGIVRNLI